MKRVCVVGAGISGLSTAVRIQEKLGANVEVTILSEQFSPHTTGDGAAGIIELHAVKDTRSELIKRWLKETFDHCHELYNSELSREAGVCSTSAYMVERQKTDPLYRDFLFDYRWLPKDEAHRHFPQLSDKNVHILHVTTLLCECRMYLPYLMKLFKSSGGKIEQRKVHSFSELTVYDVVVNCTGIGAGPLTHDSTLRPMRGQSFRVKAPWIKSSIMFGDHYVLACANNVMVGGTHQEDDWRTEPCDRDAEFIWEGACKLVPSLKHGVIEHQWAGLRPYRPFIRVEKELIQTAQKKLPVIHNYGHGGAGISLHWGCANDASDLVAETVNKLYAKL